MPHIGIAAGPSRRGVTSMIKPNDMLNAADEAAVTMTPEGFQRATLWRCCANLCERQDCIIELLETLVEIAVERP